jgi:lipid A oxidase
MIALALGADPAAAEFQVGLYGASIAPNGTNVTLNSVPWDGASFEDPPYWGARGIYWFDNHPNWGLMVDYNHAKVIAEKVLLSASQVRIIAPDYLEVQAKGPPANASSGSGWRDPPSDASK